MVLVGFEDIRESGRDDTPHVLKVVGIGGGGGNAVNRMISSGITSVEFIVANTDLQDLKSSLAPHKIQLGGRCTRGLGAGAKPDVGREAALEDVEAIKEHLNGADMVFITAGLGGGTGTGAAPVIAEISREMGALTVGVVTKPFKFEGKVRRRNGEEGILQLRKNVDTLIVIPNDNLMLLANKQTSIVDAFTMADDVLRVAIQGISEVMNDNGLINLDFADVQTVMSNSGPAIMGKGTGTGDSRAIEAAEKAIHSPLLDDCRIDGAKGILMNITGPRTLTLQEATDAADFVTANADDNAVIMFGVALDDNMPEDQIEVTVIATGFNGAPIQGPAELREPARRPSERPPFSVFSSARNGTLREEEDEEEDTFDLAGDKEDLTDPMPFRGASTLVEEEPPDDGLEEEDVYELKDPVLEKIETRPQVPDSYRPDEPTESSPNGSLGTNLDIPRFLRDRAQRLPED